MTRAAKVLLFFVLLVIPGLLALATAEVAFTRAKSVDFCASCHVMTPWVENVTGEDSDSLASDHFRNRWIQHDQCYTCHTNYDFLGPIEAKIKGMRHLLAFYFGDGGPIELYEDYPNSNCLHCHEHAKGFREDSNHEPLEDVLSGKDRCVECHENVHGVEQDESAEDAGDAGEAQDGEDEEGEETAKPAAGDSEEEGE